MWLGEGLSIQSPIQCDLITKNIDTSSIICIQFKLTYKSEGCEKIIGRSGYIIYQIHDC